ncbi:MAG: sigma-70 family RNA polymerase sigma factor [Pseudomonadota bacterium]
MNHAALRARDELIKQYLDLVPPIARHVQTQLPPSFEIDDLIGEGYLGLMQAAARYRPRRHNGTPFSAFARPRIHGAMVDSVRRKAWRENTACPIEDAPEGVSQPLRPYLIKYNAGAPRRRRPVMQFPGFDLRRLPKPLAVALQRLPARQRAVLRAFYGDCETTETVARLLGLTVPQVVTAHSAALDKLHAALLDNVSLIGSTLVFLSKPVLERKAA